MLTQDAIPANADAFLKIVEPFEEISVGMAYGRQLPRPRASAIERHARLHNYPDRSEARSLADKERLGAKTAFCSNSFAAYRVSSLEAVGNFPKGVIFAEDQIVAGKMLLAGMKIAYAADAQVIHSHAYTIAEEFKRYFDIGAFHAHNQWLIEQFGQPEGEGWKFFRSEIAYLLKNDPWLLASCLPRTVAKYAAYKLGVRESLLSNRQKRLLSMSRNFWN